jgi:hypothetical protein
MADEAFVTAVEVLVVSRAWRVAEAKTAARSVTPTFWMVRFIN